MRALLLIMLLGMGACSTSKDGGNEGPGGGDVTAQQAGELTGEIYSAVRSAPRTYPEVNLADLQATIARARILIRPRTYANGVETDANNNGVDLIEINRQRWGLISERDRKRALLFHEILGLMGLEKNNYFISSRLLKAKNRFTDERNYTCTYGGITCSIFMRFDRAQDGFIVREDSVCGGFSNFPINIFKRLNDSTYSTNGYCPETEPSIGSGNFIGEEERKAQAPCMVHSGDGKHWDTLNFLDGYEFFFNGFFDENRGTDRQLHCRP